MNKHSIGQIFTKCNYHLVIHQISKHNHVFDLIIVNHDVKPLNIYIYMINHVIGHVITHIDNLAIDHAINHRFAKY